jgi:Acyl-CoA reductase (LuxC)
MLISERIDLLVELGHYLSRDETDLELEKIIHDSYAENQWFTPENQQSALKAIATKMLRREALEAWIKGYTIGNHEHPQRNIALIMAGNIPLVGFHDWLCVFLAGERAIVKLSDKDSNWMPFLTDKLGEWNFESREYTTYVTEGERLHGFDAVVATGSNNTARYFQQYFGKYPHIIRHNRNSVALLNGQESIADLYALGRDIFSYFGLGCRNVSKIYVPQGYSFEPLLEALHEYNEIIHHNKYKNNFDYNMTLLVMNNVKYMNNGCLILQEDTSLSSRIASLHYEYYDTTKDLDQKISALLPDIQCVVGNTSVKNTAVLPFGKTQEPGLMDYPDGVDVMQFLLRL